MYQVVQLNCSIILVFIPVFLSWRRFRTTSWFRHYDLEDDGKVGEKKKVRGGRKVSLIHSLMMLTENISYVMQLPCCELKLAITIIHLIETPIFSWKWQKLSPHIQSAFTLLLHAKQVSLIKHECLNKLSGDCFTACTQHKAKLSELLFWTPAQIYPLKHKFH